MPRRSPEMRTTITLKKGVIDFIDGIAKSFEKHAFVSRGEVIEMMVDYIQEEGLEDEIFGDVLDALENGSIEVEDSDRRAKKEESDTCDECGADIPSDALFCPHCGVEFEEEESGKEESEDEADEDEEEDDESEDDEE